MVMLTDDQHEDTDGDGFTEFNAGTDINDINSTPGIDFGGDADGCIRMRTTMGMAFKR